MTASGVLSLDVAMRLGWAWALPGPTHAEMLGHTPKLRGLVSGSVDIDRRRFPEDFGRLYCALEDWLVDQLAARPTGTIVFEAPFIRGGFSDRIQLGLTAIVERTARREGCDTFEKAPSSIKKFATGRGHATKPEMLAAARAKGWRPIDHNEADALHLLALTLSTLAEARAA